MIDLRLRHIRASRISLIYLFFGLAWILFSTYLGPLIEPDPDRVRNYELIKGSMFVVLSASLVFVLARRVERAHAIEIRRAGMFQSVVDNAADMIFWLATPDGREILYASPAIEPILGLPRANAYDDPQKLWKLLENSADEIAASRPHLIRDGEYRVVLSDGTERWIASQAYPVTPFESDESLVAGLLLDITDRKNALEALKEREHLWLRAQQVGKLGHWMHDRTTEAIFWSDEVYRIVDRQPDEFEPTYEGFLEFVYPEDRPKREAAGRALVEEKAPLDLRYRIVLPGGEVRYVHDRALLSDVTSDLVIGTVQDVTAQVRLEQELRVSRDLVRRWAAREVSIRERERLEIAREIHDDLGQLLTVLRMRLERAESDDVSDDRVRENLEIVDAATDSVRNLSGRLRPPALEELGMLTAVEDHARRFGERTGLEVEIITEIDEPRMDVEESVHLYRLVQEALTNVARHANATRASVTLRELDGHLKIEVCDDGSGWPSIDIHERGHGVIGMRERAFLLNGTLDLGDSELGGARVTAMIPVPEKGRV